MKEKLVRLLRAVLGLVLRERGWRQTGAPPPGQAPAPAPPKEEHRG